MTPTSLGLATPFSMGAWVGTTLGTVGSAGGEGRDRRAAPASRVVGAVGVILEEAEGERVVGIRQSEGGEARSMSGRTSSIRRAFDPGMDRCP